MASAQVLPSSRKQEHLEAGKRRLEEFRKKKAAERAKKAPASSPTVASDVIVDNKKPLETESVRLTNIDGAGTSDRPGSIDATISNDNNTISTTSKVEQGLFIHADTRPPSTSHAKTSLPDTLHTHENNYDFISSGASGFAGAADVKYSPGTDELNNGFNTYDGSHGRVPDSSLSHNFIAPGSQESHVYSSSFSQSNPFQSTENNRFIKDSTSSSPYGSAFQPQNEINYAGTLATDFTQSNNNLRGSGRETEQGLHGGMHFNGSLSSDFGGNTFSSSPGGFPSAYGKDTQTSESFGSDSDTRSSLNHTQLFSGTSEPNSRRSRPSFLDTLNVNRASSGTSFQPTEQRRESFLSSALKSDGIGGLGSSTFQKPPVETQTVGQHPVTFSVASSNGVDPVMSAENSWKREHELFSSKQNEDFSTLEQHIEDLTQEKFSLQRALEASRALAESLAAENSSLTDNYNQQRNNVNQLKSDMENLQEEIKVHLAELESVQMEYGNAKLECNAADERAKILASEVIGLEEKALRLRSNELKLERQLENSHAEIASSKKKMSSLERERQDLQLTIDALKEEKKLLQSKLRKASASGKSIDISQSASSKKDMSTSTEDLDVIPDHSNQEIRDTASLMESDTPSFPVLPGNGQSILVDSSVNIPPDQMRMIENINTLISELALEKEELVQSLASESSERSRLKVLNDEMSRKLEAQTQRLELLTAQSMANENIQARLPDSRTMHETTTYADEGDEVVERVLGWIMKLFPGGPSKRRTSKLL